MTNVDERSFVVTVDRIEGEYAVCLMPDYSTVDVKFANQYKINENDKVEVKYNENCELEILRVMPRQNFKRRKLPPKFIRFR